MDVRLLFPNQYIGAADLHGKDVTLTIDRLVVEGLKTDRGTEKKPVVYFREMEARHRRGEGENKRLVLNKTNAKVIGELYGYETDGWKGKRVTFFPTTCQAFGKEVDCVRVRPTEPRGKAPPPAPAPPVAPPEYDDSPDAGLDPRM
jgi:hypothetical protein